MRVTMSVPSAKASGRDFEGFLTSPAMYAEPFQPV